MELKLPLVGVLWLRSGHLWRLRQRALWNLPVLVPGLQIAAPNTYILMYVSPESTWIFMLCRNDMRCATFGDLLLLLNVTLQEPSTTSCALWLLLSAPTCELLPSLYTGETPHLYKDKCNVPAGFLQRPSNQKVCCLLSQDPAERGCTSMFSRVSF